MNIAYAVPMTWACSGLIAPFSQVNELVARGHHVDVFAPDERPVTWFPLRVRPKRLERISEAERTYDAVVHAGDSFRAARSYGASPRFLLLQGKDYLWVGGTERKALLEAYADRQYSILAVSQWLADFARERCNNERVAVIGNGVDLTRFFPDAEPHERVRLLIEGNPADPNKNLREALEVAARVRQYRNIEVWALGRKFPSPGALVSRIFEDPPQDSIPDIYRKCDLLIKTSITEGFGLPHLEAMACGCVPATYASGGVVDFCRHGENSIVTGIGNVATLVWHVLCFIGDVEMRRRLKANAIATAQARPWGRVAGALEKAFVRGLEGL
jgi:glycosyltransferase involved in cell wall biosynthesis